MRDCLSLLSITGYHPTGLPSPIPPKFHLALGRERSGWRRLRAKKSPGRIGLLDRPAPDKDFSLAS
jgi:hypothetical protein